MEERNSMFANEEICPPQCFNWFKRSLSVIALIIFSLTVSGTALADEVTDWHQHTINLLRTSNASPVATMRIFAIEQAAVFDAVNGIERRFTHIYVRPNVSRRASTRAAAIEAAYATLIRFFPAQRADLDARREASLNAITDERPDQISQGVRWGQRVAEEILALRCGDGSDAVFPPFTGGTAPGEWRPTPPGNLPGQTPELARMTPFVMTSPSQFRPAGPPALASAQYAADFNEVKTLGKDTGSARTDEQTEIGIFWADNAHLHWNRIALSVAASRADSLVDNARLFALLNLALADANIVARDAKYHFNWWRPITAIRLADTDGNGDTAPDASWTPLLVTPNHPEYASGHSTLSGAAARVLAALFGDNTSFTHGSDTLAGVTRTHSSFSAAAAEVNESRIFAGAHFRFACIEGEQAGAAVGNLAVSSLARPNRSKDQESINLDDSANPALSCPTPITIYPDAFLFYGTVGVPYSQSFWHQGGYNEVSWHIPYGAVLPDGLMLNSTTGVISGTPISTGTYYFFLRATSTFNGWCYGESRYGIEVKAASATTITVSDSPVTTGQSIRLTAVVNTSQGSTPTGSVKFTLNGSPIGAAPLVGGAAPLNISAPTASNSSYSIIASYSGDGHTLPSSSGLALTVFDYSVQDDTTGDILYFNWDGTYHFISCARGSNLVLRGRGTILSSATGCGVTLEHSAADRDILVEINPCELTGTGTVSYQGTAYTLTDIDMKNNMNPCR